MPLLLFVFARRSLYATYSLPYRAQLLFCQDTRKSTLRRKNNFPNNCVRTYLRHDIGTHMPKPPSSACCTSHTHAPTRPPVHPTMPSTRHLSLTSQLTNTSPAHMQPGIHQSRPPPNVLRSSHYHHNQNTLTSQLKHPPHTCHPCLTNPTLPPTSLVKFNHQISVYVLTIFYLLP